MNNALPEPFAADLGFPSSVWPGTSPVLPPVDQPAAESTADHAENAGAVGESSPGHEPLGEQRSVNPPATEDAFVPRPPKSLQQTQLAEVEIQALILKFLLLRGSQPGRLIADQVKLPFAVVERILLDLKQELLIGIRGSAVGGDYRFELTARGFEQARQFMALCTYCGSAPVAFDQYLESVERQSIRNLYPTFETVSRALSDLVVSRMVVSQIGQALRSSRPVLLHGAPGNGKSSIARRAIRAVGQSIWIPRTITVGGEIIRLFDPSVHQIMPLKNKSLLEIDDEIDNRWVRIARPSILVGGELNLNHLETQLNPSTGINEAPIHVKSNCGCLVVDDFGRQRVSTTELLNRWIVPLECGHDFLNLPSGRQVQVPFEQLLIFSTNLAPSNLCEEAFLRRIPYKIHIGDPTLDQFRELFQRRACDFGFEFAPELFDWLVETYYRKSNRTMRFCHVDDLLSLARDFCDFHQCPRALKREMLAVVAATYFSGM